MPINYPKKINEPFHTTIETTTLEYCQYQHIMNNLSSIPVFCPLNFKIKKPVFYSEKYHSDKKAVYIKNLQANVSQVASTFLLLKVSKASYNVNCRVSIGQR